jgi:hypothetical protein
MPETPERDYVTDLCDPDSDTCHGALADLAVVLDQLGFKVRKKPAKEATLRVYCQGKSYPLLNPRFRLVPTDDAEGEHLLALVVTVLSKGDDALDNRLKSFESGQGIGFIAVTKPSGQHYCHGHFVIPLEGAIQDDHLDLSRVSPSLRAIFQTCDNETTMNAG